jgi:hypothetical protein
MDERRSVMASGGGKKRKASVVVAEAGAAARDGRGGAGEDQGGARDGEGLWLRHRAGTGGGAASFPSADAGDLFRARRGDGSTPPICTRAR